MSAAVDQGRRCCTWCRGGTSCGSCGRNGGRFKPQTAGKVYAPNPGMVVVETTVEWCKSGWAS
eukprot:3978002-Amphidinium_carterae.1